MPRKKEEKPDFYKNAATGKILVISLVVVAVFAVLWLIYSATPGTPGTAPSAGKAVSGLGGGQIGLGSVANGFLVINPPSGTAALNEPFTLEVLVNPADAGLPAAGGRFNNYQFDLAFNPAVIRYVSARNLVAGAGWTFTPTLNAAGNVLTIKANAFTDYFDNNARAIADITFTPIALSAGVPVTPSNFVNVNAYGPGGTSLSIITNYNPGTVLIYNRWYPDIDRDGYGNSADPGFVGVQPAGSVLDHSDCDDNNNAVNPGALEICDGVNNNCANGLNDEVPPTCGELAVQCGIHRVCANSRFLDCNKAGAAFDGALLSGADKCGGGLICNNDNGQCVSPAAACPAATVCPTMPQSLTPACGIDVDGDGNRCDYFENMLSCPTDCISCPDLSGAMLIGGVVADSLTGAAPAAAAANPCATPDTDGDGLSDAYENKLDLQMQAHGFAANSGFNLALADSDRDEVNDALDYCPATNTQGGQFLLSNGRINVNGCYSGDVGTDNAGVRPNGCFNLKDSTFLIDYYTGRNSCASELVPRVD